MEVKAKKSLGQNWLRNEKIVGEIVAAANLKASETVVEVGPGQGVLTAPLLEAGVKVIAIEKDDSLIELLQVKFKKEIKAGQLEIIHHDALEFDPILINQPYKIVANLPYYITGEFLKKFLTTPHQPELMVLMLQREVAERIVARDKKESVLSMSVKVYGTPKYVRLVSKGNFQPVPKVDSAILSIEKINKNNFKNLSEEKFFRVLKMGFSSKRKQLKNNLDLSGELLEHYGNKRAEDLQLTDWLKLCAEN
ncbi:MAG: ribosomal RNA small subunit methyltransferase A [Candidatus Pacebacteria bacterium]|nr:ribosomal RNA small subunit methyltransferase A [Candidatus Paceibacterota bacterium]